MARAYKSPDAPADAREATAPATTSSPAQSWASAYGNAALARSAAPPLTPVAAGIYATAPATLARAPADAPAAEAGAEKKTDQLADLAKRAGSAAGLRALLAANPALAQQIPAYLAKNEDTALNELMGAAFAKKDKPEDGAQADAAEGPVGVEKEPVSKDPANPKVPLPAPIKDKKKKLDKGEMTWSLEAKTHESARADIDFKPDETKVEAKTVSFVQTVVNKVGRDLAYAGGTAADPGKNKAKFEPFEEAGSKKRVDHLVEAENDPFYGAEWDQGAKAWKGEGGGTAIGSSTKGGTSTSAKMNDTPGIGWGRIGKGDASIEFEAVALVLETRQPLGSLKWGFKVKDTSDSPIELTGAQDADCVDTPSEEWSKTLDQYYAAKYSEILDDFTINKSDLKPDHKTKLDNVVTKMKANVALKAQLGGAADLTGNAARNQQLSLERATAARDYLVSKGIDASRLEVQSYGADWARVEAEAGKSEGKNRRVQVWVH